MTVLGERVATGTSADIFAYGHDRVVKLFRPEYGLLAEEEAERTAAVWDAGLPCPRVHGVVEEQGRQGIVMDRVEGPTLLEPPGAGAASTADAAGQLARLHRQLHASSPVALPTWRSVASAASASLGPAEHAEFQRLVAALPDGDTTYHGDFHPGNVIMGQRGPVVVDWPNACRAHPAVDVARTVVLLRYHRISNVPAEVARSRRAVADAYVTAYVDNDPELVRQIQASLPLHTAGLHREDPENPATAELEALSAGQPDLFLSRLLS